MKRWQAESLLFFITLIWGGTFSFTKLGLDYCPPSLFILFRFTIALAISLIFFGKYLPGIDKKTFLHGSVLGIFFGIGFLLQTYGLKFTSITNSAFITGMSVPLTPFVYWIIERKAINLWQKAGVVASVVGFWIFANPDINNINIGDLFTLLSTFFWALYISYMDIFTRDRTEFRDTARLVILQLVTVTPIAAGFYFVYEYSSTSLVINEGLIAALAYNGIIASFLLTFIHTSVQRFTTPVKAALIFSLEPVIAGIIAFIAFNEIISERGFIGGAIILTGVFISQSGSVIDKLLRKPKGKK